MKLSERQLQILQAIIYDYVENAEPVGSRSIAKKYDFGVSPATIRNEMSDLEDMGYLTHPHTSAGRVPSDKAYRLYVDDLMQKRSLSAKEKRFINERLAANRDEFDQTIRHAAKLLSEITQLTSFVMTPTTNQDTISFVKLLPADEETVILMIVGDSGRIMNTSLRIDNSYSKDVLDILSKNITVNYKGRTLDEVLQSEIVKEASSDIETLNSLIGKVRPTFIKTLEDMLDVNLYMEGMTNIFDIPEYSSIDKAKAFLEIFSKREEFTRKILERGDGVVVTIGDENDSMEDCSLITATYHVDGKLVGKIGVIGPTRMKYDEITSIIEYFTKNLNETFKLTDGKDK
ncbi:MAG TPA: heat-inducible transcription repressor HrcA [Mogibacterium sp.]|nr:heat-inducible transcription repressor HrcA [Mogibacterium sp.]